MLEETREKREIVSGGSRISRKLQRGEMGREKKTNTIFHPKEEEEEKGGEEEKVGWKEKTENEIFPDEEEEIGVISCLDQLSHKKIQTKKKSDPAFAKSFSPSFYLRHSANITFFDPL